MAESTICCQVTLRGFVDRRQRSQKVDAEKQIRHAQQPQQTITGQLLCAVVSERSSR